MNCFGFSYIRLFCGNSFAPIRLPYPQAPRWTGLLTTDYRLLSFLRLVLFLLSK
jgi:hypothetical protein